LKAIALKEFDQLKKERVKMEDKYERNLEKTFLNVFSKPGLKFEKYLKF